MTTPITPKRGSQSSQILAYIKIKGFINHKLAINELGIVSLTARISDLRKMGWKIVGIRPNTRAMMTYRLEADHV